jgi:hypothetical protein
MGLFSPPLAKTGSSFVVTAHGRSRTMNEPMPLMMRIKKRLHYLICCWCQRYEEQLRYMRHTARQFPEHPDEASDAPLSAEVRERINEDWRKTLVRACVCPSFAKTAVLFKKPALFLRS